MTEREGLPPFCAVLGATGSVGTQALDVARTQHIPVRLMTARRDVAGMETRIRTFHPQTVVMTEEAAAKDLRVRIADTDTRVLAGAEAVCGEIDRLRPPVVIHAILGEAGLAPAFAAVDAGCRVGLANKETVVIAGELLMQRAAEKGAVIVPVDSEHSAIFQCLKCGRKEEVRRIWLTASGGPFFGYTPTQLEKVTPAMALAHPTWKMGAKITVDSADLMNKGFEVIEAVRLFGVTPEQVEVLVHRESIIHSAVEYIDHAVIAQMSVPDMRLCVQYALSYPQRVVGELQALDLAMVGQLTFARPDTVSFPLLALAYDCVRRGGGMGAVLNAANEVAVEAFLEGHLSFPGIAQVVQETVRTHLSAAADTTLAEFLEEDRAARQTAAALIARRAK